MSVILVLKNLRKKACCEFEASLGYTVRFYLKNKKIKATGDRGLGVSLLSEYEDLSLDLSTQIKSSMVELACDFSTEAGPGARGPGSPAEKVR